jgi:hypothetical protein
MSLQFALPNEPFQIFSSHWFGKDSLQIAEAKKNVLAPLFQNRKTEFSQQKNASSLEEQLYDAKAFCKIETSKVAMYFPNEWRKGFFSQLDNLMDIDNWEEDEKPVTKESFSTLLRMLTFIKPARRPGLGTTSSGNIIAAWTNEKDRLTIECLSKDRVRWVLSHIIDDIRESAAGEVQLTRLQVVLSPYSPNRWFTNGS